MQIPRWLAASVGHVRDSTRRLTATSVPWLRVGGLGALVILGSGAAASGAQVSGQAVVPVPVPVLSAATVQAYPGPLAIVTVPRAPTDYRVVPTAAVAPPPPAIVLAPGGLGIPKIALAAYRNAERMMAKAAPGCGVSWNLLAGIGRIESGHANNGATDAKGRVVRPIYGPRLDGTLAGNAIVVDHDRAGLDGDPVYERAVGPMQFLPETWKIYAVDGDGDGVADPQNVFDASLAAARYLCAGGLNLRDHSQVVASILRYNNSMAYAKNVLAWAAGYATGVFPINLPPLTAADTAPERKAHLAGRRGLGPGSVLDVAALSPEDPLARLPMVNPMAPDQAGIVGPPGVSAPVPVAPAPAATESAGPEPAACFVFCAPPPPPAFPTPALAPLSPPPDPFAPFAPFAPPTPAQPLGPAPGPTP